LEQWPIVNTKPLVQNVQAIVDVKKGIQLYLLQFLTIENKFLSCILFIIMDSENGQ